MYKHTNTQTHKHTHTHTCTHTHTHLLAHVYTRTYAYSHTAHAYAPLTISFATNATNDRTHRQHRHTHKHTHVHSHKGVNAKTLKFDKLAKTLMDLVTRPEDEDEDEDEEMANTKILQGEEPDDSKLLGPLQASITALRSMELGTIYAKQCVFYIDHVLVCVRVCTCVFAFVCSGVSLLFPRLGFAYSRLIIFPPRPLLRYISQLLPPCTPIPSDRIPRPLLSFKRAQDLLAAQLCWKNLIIHQFKALRNAPKTAETKASWGAADEDEKERRREEHKQKKGRKKVCCAYVLCTCCTCG